jgi:hypothetical protein
VDSTAARPDVRGFIWFSVLELPVLAAWIVMFLAGGKQSLLAWILLTQLFPLFGLIGLAVLLFRTLKHRRATPAMIAGYALALVALWPGLWGFGVLPIAYPASLEGTQPAATVRLPADAPLRVFWGGDALSGNYHAMSPGQRWAYDLTVEPAATGSSKLDDYGCWGTPVLAPIAAKVHRAGDGVDDLAPGETLADPAKLLGNYVILELETRTYLVIAHLQNGSVAVKTGDAVSEGQLLGRCGNSGNTSEPHIHIHHQRQDPLSINGDLNLGVNLVEGLPLYFRDHNGAPIPAGGFRMEGERIVLTGDVVRHAASIDDPGQL